MLVCGSESIDRASWKVERAQSVVDPGRFLKELDFIFNNIIMIHRNNNNSMNICSNHTNNRIVIIQVYVMCVCVCVCVSRV